MNGLMKVGMAISIVDRSSLHRLERRDRRRGSILAMAMITIIVVGLMANAFLMMGGISAEEVNSAEVRRQLVYDAVAGIRRYINLNLGSVEQKDIEAVRTGGKLAVYHGRSSGAEVVIRGGEARHFEWSQDQATILDGEKIFSLDARLTATVRSGSVEVVVGVNVGVPSLAEWGIINKDGDWHPRDGYVSSGPMWLAGDFYHDWGRFDPAVVYGDVHANRIRDWGGDDDVIVTGGQFEVGSPGYKAGGDYTPGDASNGEDGDDRYFAEKEAAADIVLYGNKEIYLGRDGLIYVRDYLTADEPQPLLQGGLPVRQSEIRSLYVRGTVFVKGTVEGRFTLFSHRDVVVHGRIYNNDPDRHVLGIASKDDVFFDFRPLTQQYTPSDPTESARYGWDPWWGVDERWRNITDTSREDNGVGSVHHTTGILDTNARRQPLPFDYNTVDRQPIDADHMGHPMDWAPWITPFATSLSSEDAPQIAPTDDNPRAHFKFNNQIAAVFYSADDFEFLTHQDVYRGREEQFGHALYRPDLGALYEGRYGFNPAVYYENQLRTLYPGYNWERGFHLFGGVTAEGQFNDDWRMEDWFPNRHYGFNPAQKRNPPPEFPSGFRGQASMRLGSWTVEIN